MEAVSSLQLALPGKAWIFYDGDCPLCSGGAARAEALLRAHGFLLLPLQTPGVTDRLGVPREELLRELKLLTTDGRLLGGADAMLEISRAIWWATPLVFFAKLPGALPLLRWLYARVAANRYCLSNACSIRPRGHRPALAVPTAAERLSGLPVISLRGLLPLLVFPVFAFLARSFVPAWVFMWLLAFSLFAGCKWLTFHEARAAGAGFLTSRAFGYLFAWIGMDPTAFRVAAPKAKAPCRNEWYSAGVITILGVALLWGGARLLQNAAPLAAGWTGMLGIILTLHFGSFRLLALAWRSFGVAAEPLMHKPWSSASVSEFWGRRWNTGFHRLAHRFLFLPAMTFGSKRTAAAASAHRRPGAVLFVFLSSGLIHDLVITVPAGGGYGLPTGYFLFQGCALIFERSSLGRALGLGSGWRGRLFALLVTAGPAFWLFPPVFVQRIILPMLQAIGAF